MSIALSDSCVGHFAWNITEETAKENVPVKPFFDDQYVTRWVPQS